MRLTLPVFNWPTYLCALVCCLADHVSWLSIPSNDVEATCSVRNCRDTHLGGVLPDDLSYFTTSTISDLMKLCRVEPVTVGMLTVVTKVHVVALGDCLSVVL